MDFFKRNLYFFKNHIFYGVFWIFQNKQKFTFDLQKQHNERALPPSDYESVICEQDDNAERYDEDCSFAWADARETRTMSREEVILIVCSPEQWLQQPLGVFLIRNSVLTVY